MTRAASCSAVLLRLLLALLLGLCRADAAFDPPSGAPCRTCAAQPGCLNVTTVPYSVTNFAASSPLYKSITLSTCESTRLDSECITYFPIDGDNWLVFDCKNYDDGEIKIEVYISSTLQNSPGSHRLQGLTSDSGCSTLLSQLCVLGLACEDTWVVYQCNYYYGEDSMVETEQDVRFVLSSSKVVDPCCRNRVQAIINSRSFLGTEFHNSPYQRVPKCVATFNGAPCVNYDRLTDDQKLALPSDSLYTPPCCNCSQAASA